MEEVAEDAQKNWGHPCPECDGKGKNMCGAECHHCGGYGRIGNGAFAPLAPGVTMKETVREVHRQITVNGCKIDLRGKPGPIAMATAQALAVDIDCTIRDMQLPNRRDAKGAYMHGRLLLRVRTNLPQELPEHYEKLVEALKRFNTPLWENTPDAARGRP